jgi:hypothetical protein
MTHAASQMMKVPTAHSPMEFSSEVSNWDPGITDPRIAAESVSVAYLQCILKGLQRSPKIITDNLDVPGIISAKDISALVIPDNVLGLPTFAALHQGIPVITVKNKNIMQNDLSELPWMHGQLHHAENYLEVAGILTALKDGMDPRTLKRPLFHVPVTIENNI